jgi:hypothetical protein
MDYRLFIDADVLEILDSLPKRTRQVAGPVSSNPLVSWKVL